MVTRASTMGSAAPADDLAIANPPLLPGNSPADIDQLAGRRHFKPLDGVRGLAVLLVIFAHSYSYYGSGVLPQTLNFLAGVGWLGVTLFFSLSGLLIGGILMDAVGTPGWYRGFFFRRALRIMPLYFGFLTVYCFITPLWHRTAQLLPAPDVADGITFWLYLANMRETLFHHVDHAGGLAPLWSVSVEEQFYLLFPLIICYCPRKRLAGVLVTLMGCSALWKIAMGLARQGIELRYNWTPACLDALAGGALVACLSRDAYWRPRLKSIAAVASVLSGLFIIAISIRDRSFNFWFDPLVILIAGSFAVAIFFSAGLARVVMSDSGSRINHVLSMRWLRWCGQYSYAAYVFHEPTIDLLRPTFGPWTVETGYGSMSRSLLFSLLAGLLTFAAARICWEVFEKHFLALKRYFPMPRRVVDGVLPAAQPLG